MPRDLKIVVMAALTAGACIVFTLTLVQASLYAGEAEIPPETILSATSIPAEHAPSGSLPARLTVPTLDIEAAVQYVGINTAGNMAVPTNYIDVGWYRYGTVPGFQGSAVIDGHLDNGFGQPAVFNRIGTLHPGDEIFIQTEDGTMLEFEVEAVETYELADVPLERLFNRTDRARLNLVTCGGEWDAAAKDYAERVVVYAVLV